MIWTIRDLKKKARKLLKNCYWPAVAVCLLTTMLTGWIGSAGIGIGRIQAENASGLEMSEQRMRELKDDLKDRNPIAEYKISIVQKQLNLLVFVFAVTASIMIVVLGLLVIFCIGNPVKVSSKRFFMCNRKRTANIGMILYVFRNHYTMHVTAAMFYRTVSIIGHGLLLVVPGIIKHYEYSLIPYILAENPGMDSREAFALSKQMMDGEKANAFMLGLSFIGWYILTIITCGIAGVFYVYPYVYATYAELYAYNKEKAFQQGWIH